MRTDLVFDALRMALGTREHGADFRLVAHSGTRAQLELAVVEHIGWFNHDRLHEALGDIPPLEFEALHARRFRPIAR